MRLWTSLPVRKLSSTAHAMREHTNAHRGAFVQGNFFYGHCSGLVVVQLHESSRLRPLMLGAAHPPRDGAAAA